MQLLRQTKTSLNHNGHFAPAQDEPRQLTLKMFKTHTACHRLAQPPEACKQLDL